MKNHKVGRFFGTQCTTTSITTTTMITEQLKLLLHVAQQLQQLQHLQLQVAV